MTADYQALFPTLFTALFTILGLLIGSFLNVCIYRIVRDVSVVTPRSFCPACGVPIAGWDNIPVLSYLILRGKCRHCAEHISLRYPAVELLTAVIFALLGHRYGMHWATLKWCVFEALLIALFFTDLEERILPDELTLGGTAAGIVFALFVPVAGVVTELFIPGALPVLRSLTEVVVAAFLLTVPIWLLGTVWGRLRGREMIGLGDIKLLPLIGVFLGLEQGINALLIGSVSGVILGGGYILVTRQKPGSYQLPLGTFFCLGAGLLPLLNHI